MKIQANWQITDSSFYWKSHNFPGNRVCKSLNTIHVCHCHPPPFSPAWLKTILPLSCHQSSLGYVHFCSENVLITTNSSYVLFSTSKIYTTSWWVNVRVNVLSIFSRECPSQTKELLRKLLEVSCFSVGHFPLLLSSWTVFNGYNTTCICAVTNAQAKRKTRPLCKHKHIQTGCNSFGNSYLAAETLRELIACFFLCFVSTGTLRNFREWRRLKKHQNSLTGDTPCFHPTSINPLPLLNPNVQLEVFIRCGNSSLIPLWYKESLHTVTQSQWHKWIVYSYWPRATM